MHYRNNFSKRLIELRKSYSLLQKDIANYLGVTVQAYSLLEKANRSPSFEVLIALADYFNVPIDYLVGRTDKSWDENFICRVEDDFFKYCQTEDENRGLNLLKYSLYKNLPSYYKDAILRKQNYSVEIRAKILFILKLTLSDLKESIVKFENTKKKIESNVLNNISMFINYQLQKIGLKDDSFFDIDNKDGNKKLKLSRELHQLLLPKDKSLGEKWKSDSE